MKFHEYLLDKCYDSLTLSNVSQIQALLVLSLYRFWRFLKKLVCCNKERCVFSEIREGICGYHRSYLWGWW